MHASDPPCVLTGLRMVDLIYPLSKWDSFFIAYWDVGAKLQRINSVCTLPQCASKLKSKDTLVHRVSCQNLSWGQKNTSPSLLDKLFLKYIIMPDLACCLFRSSLSSLWSSVSLALLARAASRFFFSRASRVTGSSLLRFRFARSRWPSLRM